MKKGFFRKVRTAVLLLAICAAGTGCAKEQGTAASGAAAGTVPSAAITRGVGTETPVSVETGAAQTEPTKTESGQSRTEGETPDDNVTSIEISKPVTGWYFKEGDFRYRMEAQLDGRPDRQGFIQMAFSVREKTGAAYGERSDALVPLHCFDISYRGKAESYVVPDSGRQEKSADYTVAVNTDGTIVLEGDTEAAGRYYPHTGNLMLPDQYERPLNATDLIGLEKADLRLLRNEIYAVYGRKFNSRDLQSYFEAKDWYRGVTEPEAFDETVLGGMMRRNVAFLKTAEEAFDEEVAASDRRTYRALVPAPYLDLLPEHGETLVSISSDPGTAADCGIYYVARGSISVPISVSSEEYKSLEAGNPVELTVDELTGETAILKKTPDSRNGSYCFGDESSGNYAEAAYDRWSGRWFFWGDSADTRFKRVYEGDIYVLKGATEEYYYNFELQAEERVEEPGGYRVIDFTGSERWNQAPYSGNILVSDPNGYVKALYFYGD